MDHDQEVKEQSYFRARQLDAGFYDDTYLSPYLIELMAVEKSSAILDIGCGFGQTMAALQKFGCTSLTGIDISDEALNVCRKKGLNVFKISDITTFTPPGEKYDFAIMSHVLEHLEKNKVIATLTYIRTHLLKDTGKVLLMVPNAQSPTGAYWAYEDFTHHTMFTAGSLIYVLKSAGFGNIKFIDTDNSSLYKGWKWVRMKLLLRMYRYSQKLKFMATGATYHQPSPVIYTWEIKVLAANS